MTSVRTSTAQDIIKGALLKAGITPAEQAINAVDQENALEALNDLIKHWQAQGFHLWTKTEGVIFLNKDQQKYKLGPNGADASTEFVDTALTVAAASSATQLTLPTAGMNGAPDLLNNPTNSLQGWTTTESTIVTALGVLTVTNTLASNGFTEFTLDTVVGDTYILTFTYTKGTSSGAVFSIRDNNTSQDLVTVTLSSTTVGQKLTFTATQLTHTFKFLNNSTGSGDDNKVSVMSMLNTNGGDNIGIELDDGTRQWTKITTVDSSTQVTIDDALTGAAALANTVYVYTDRLDRPLRIIAARTLTKPGTTETPVRIQSRDEYFEQPDKASSGSSVSNFYYSPQITQGELFVWQVASSIKQLLLITFIRPFEIAQDSTTLIDFPPEWARTLKFNLAADLHSEYRTEPQKQAQLDLKASTSLDDALGFDHEFASMRVGLDED